MLRHTLAALVAGAALFGATAAHAGTHWSIGISLPVAGIAVSDGPRYYAPEPAPVYYAPAPVVYAPAPRYVERDVYYAPPPRVVYETYYRDRRWEGRGDRWEHERHEHRDYGQRWDHDRDGYGPHRGH
ncbi:MAG: hypothetical protein JF617_18885 [Burkholderiales bacterium]|nr:hypothetical protein [Burkholderiales bacterium]